MILAGSVDGICSGEVFAAVAAEGKVSPRKRERLNQ